MLTTTRNELKELKESKYYKTLLLAMCNLLLREVWNDKQNGRLGPSISISLLTGILLPMDKIIMWSLSHCGDIMDIQNLGQAFIRMKMRHRLARSCIMKKGESSLCWYSILFIQCAADDFLWNITLIRDRLSEVT